MPRLSVKAVSNLSGLSAHTLRAWERRYQIIVPTRSETGRREYSLDDLAKLKLLGTLVNQGHSIGRLATLSNVQLKKLTLQASSLNEKFEGSQLQNEERNKTLNNLIQAVNIFDLEEIDRQILRARLGATARTFVLDVVNPLITQIGSLILEQKLDIAQEHALSAILRTHLGDLLGQVQKASNWSSDYNSDLPRLIFATPEGDLHEFGILIAAILAGSMGYKLRYFGPNMPAESLARAAVAVGAKILVLGSVKADSSRLAQSLGDYVRLLDQSLKRHQAQGASIWIGGYCDFDWATFKSRYPIKVTGSLFEFEQKLFKIKSNSEPIVAGA